jgi:HTH-type transcriptional regulator / antitoxin HigA
MDIVPIKTQRDYRHALKRIERLMTAKRGTPDGDRIDVLVTLVEAWERRHYELDFPDPIEAIKYHMDQNGLGTASMRQTGGVADAHNDSAIARRAWYSG